MRGRRRGRDGRRESVEVLVDWVGGVVSGALVRLSGELWDEWSNGFMFILKDSHERLREILS